MKSYKAPRIRNSRLCQVTARDRDVRIPPEEEKRSLNRGTIGEPCHRERSQAKWSSLADDSIQKKVLKEEMLLLEV